MKTKRNLSASIPNETRKAVYARDGYRCALCDDTHGLQIHHIIHRSCGGAPLRSGPAPRFWPRGGAILFSLRRVWGLRRLRAALEVYRTARAAQSGAVYMASP